MFGWKCASYKRSKGLFGMFGRTSLSILLVASLPLCFTGDAEELDWLGFFRGLAWTTISFVCLPSLCLVRFHIEYAPASVHPESIKGVRCDNF